MSRSCCTLSSSRLRSTAWKHIFAVRRCFLSPLMNGRSGDAQLTSHLRNRLPAGLRQPPCLLFELSRGDFLDLCHGHPFPDLLAYISALGTLPNRGKVTHRLAFICWPSPFSCFLALSFCWLIVSEVPNTLSRQEGKSDN